MDVYQTANIRNVVLLGHGGCGKTTLTEAIAYTMGVTNRMKTIEEGGTVSDFDKEEIKRKFSIQTSLLPIEWEGMKINILDTPGFFDFSGEVYEALSVADAAVIVVSGKKGVEVGTMKAFDFCEQYQLPAMVFITDMDDPNANYMDIVNQLKDLYGHKIAPFYLPIMRQEQFVGFVNAVKMEGREFNPDGTFQDIPIPDECMSDVEPIRDMILEAVAETNEEYMERYFDGGEFTQDEITDALRSNVCDGTIVPILMGSGLLTYGVRMLIYSISKYFNKPTFSAVLKGRNPKNEEPYEVEYRDDKIACCYVFKTIVDPFIGKYSMFKVCDGVVKPDMTLNNTDREAEEKIGKLYTFIGKQTVEVSELHAGDIGAVAKLSVTKTGDTLCGKGAPVSMERVPMPIPYTFMAYRAVNKGDEDKISTSIRRIMEEDLTLKEVNDKENRQLLLYGLGDQHLEVVMSKLQDRYKVSVELVEPRIAFKETITKASKVQGKYKKQSGGHGQYGDVHMEFEPSGDLETPYIFEEKIFGGAVPRNFFPAVEKGIAESCLAGPLAGYPVVGVKATLVDGSYHPVDSSEMAFKMASTQAFKEGVMAAHPVLLEPIVALKVVIPDKFAGDVMGGINKLRGRVLGMNPLEGSKQEILADIPLASLTGYSTKLRSMTGGSAEYSYEFSRYERMPSEVQAKLLEK
ncbi:MAG: elongation factor G [Lachnospiraceae bacterium]